MTSLTVTTDRWTPLFYSGKSYTIVTNHGYPEEEDKWWAVAGNGQKYPFYEVEREEGRWCWVEEKTVMIPNSMYLRAKEIANGKN